MAYGLIVVYKLIKRFGYCTGPCVTVCCGSLYVNRLCGTEQQAGFGKQWKKAGGSTCKAGCWVGHSLRVHIMGLFFPIMTHDKIHMKNVTHVWDAVYPVSYM